MMTRVMGLTVLGLALLGSAARANGLGLNGGQFSANAGVNTGLTFGYGFAPGCGYGGGGGGGVQPYQLGPWYQYWPYEAHFQTPAMPMYPYWGAMTLPNGSPVINPGYPGHGAVPNYWQPNR
jgi:hypothetical protein